jgi:hypothetical protein
MGAVHAFFETRWLRVKGNSRRSSVVAASMLRPGRLNGVSMARLKKIGECPATSEVLFERLRHSVITDVPFVHDRVAHREDVALLRRQADAEWGPQRP